MYIYSIILILETLSVWKMNIRVWFSHLVKRFKTDKLHLQFCQQYIYLYNTHFIPKVMVPINCLCLIIYYY